MKNLSTLLCCMLMFTAMQAQTLVNRAWKTTTGSPKLSIDHLAGTATGSYVILVGNTYTVGQEENMLITKYNYSGQILWQTEYNVADTLSDLGLDVHIQGSYVYVTGAAMATDISGAGMATLKLTVDSGHIVWDTAYAGAYSGFTMASAMAVDSFGNAYVAGSEQTNAMDAAMTVVKYNSAGQQQWVAHYDSIGFIDGAGGIAIADTEVVISGFSGTAFTSWHFTTATLSAATGTLNNVRYAPNANGSLNELVNVTQDYEGNLFILGTSLHSPGNTDIKLIKYDPDFEEEWVVTWGNADSTDDIPGILITDSEGNLVLTGAAGNSSGGTDLLTIRYSNTDGSMMWERRLSATDATKRSEGRDVVSAPPGSSGPVWVTGSTDNGSNTDYLTASYDIEGNLRWLKTMNDTLDSNDEALDIQYVSGGVIVSGVSTRDTITRYVSVKYEEYQKDNEVVADTANQPLYMAKQAIILFDDSVLSENFVNDRHILYGKANKVFTPAAYSYYSAKLGALFGRSYFVKVFPELTRADTMMVTRLGDTVNAPAFYNALQMIWDVNMDEQSVCDTFNRSFPLAKYAHLNLVAIPQSSIPDDPDFELYQEGLYDSSPDLDGSINILPAWDLETGDPSIRVGILDAPIDGFHEDFGGTDSTFMPGKIQGWDFQNNMDLLSLKRLALPSPHQIPFYSQHGNHMGGIVGALRNNGSGIAGVAGGDMANGNQGVSIYNVSNRNTIEQDSLHWVDGIAIARSIYTTALIGDSSDGIVYKYNLDIMNNSYGLKYWYQPDPLFYDKLNLLRDAVHAVNRIGVVFIAARGQGDGGGNVQLYPGCYNDDWVLTIAGSNSAGEWEHNHVTPRYTGGPIDISAPSQFGLTRTLSYDLQYHISGYYSSSGTSSSAAYSTGVAALLLSYYNPTHTQGQRLIHEDVEYILTHTATITGDGEEFVGAGRLNAGDALHFIHQPERTVWHFSNVTLPTLSGGFELLDTGIIVKINEPVTFYSQPNNLDDTIVSPAYQDLDTGIYKMDIYKFSEWMRHTMPATDSIIAYWPLHSQTQTWNSHVYDTVNEMNYLQPYEKAYIDSLNKDSALLSGYYYKVYNAQTGTFIRWLPSAPADEPRLSYSVLTNDNSYIPTSIKNEEAIKTRLYPNPSNEVSYLSVVTDVPENVSIKMYDIIGRNVMDIYSGIIDKSRSFDLQTRNLQRGIYIIGIETGAGIKSLKLSKL